MSTPSPNTPTAPATPTRILGPFSAMSVVIGAIIGVGIFFTPSKVASLTQDGGLALLAWVLAGLIAMCGALVFAELGARYHDSGAQYQVLRDAYGPCPAFLFVFCNATAIQGGAVAIIAHICATNLLAVVFPADRPVGGMETLGVSCLLIVAIAAANVWGVRAGAAIQNATVVGKLLALVAIAVLAAIWGRQNVLAPATPPSDPANIPFQHGHAGVGLLPIAGVMAALVPAFFSYGGWQHALWISGEIRDPGRNVPRAIVSGVAVVVAIYVLTAWATLRLLGVDGVAGSTALAADAVGVASPDWGRRIVAGAVALSAFGVLNAQLLSGPRLIYAMARDGRFFASFGRLSPRGTPTLAVMLLGAMGLGLILLAGPGGVDLLLTGAVFIDGVFFALTGLALIVLRPRLSSMPTGDPTGQPRGFRAPFFPLFPLLFVFGEIGVVVGAYLDPRTLSAAVIGLVWIFAAWGIYWLRFRAGGVRHA